MPDDAKPETPKRPRPKRLAESRTLDLIADRLARRWGELKVLAAAGLVSGLKRQVRFDLHARGGKKVGRYVADFVYQSGGAMVVEDSKGFRTEMYKWKRRHMEAEYGIVIREV